MALLYGPTGRLVSGVAGAGTLASAILFSLQQSGAFALIPPKYTWIQGVVTAVLIFITLFSERIQGGASDPNVRDAAQTSDNKKLIDQINKGD